MREYCYPIGPDAAGLQVGHYLRRRQQFSARAITKLKAHPLGLLLNGVHVRTVDILTPGDVLTVTLQESEKPLLLSGKQVEILYEDDDLMIYNKPPDMPCHTSCGHAQDTLENVYAAHCAHQGQCGRLRALNRLDRDTSGCVLVGKNQFSASLMKGRFEKTYRALVVGSVPQDGVIDGPIWRPDPVDMRRVVDARGQWAQTAYQVLCAGSGYSDVLFHLLTGRTHQIRVHMASIGFPVLGDTLYGTASVLIARQALHCASMDLLQPLTGESIHVEAPLPLDMAAALHEAIPAASAAPLDTHIIPDRKA